MSQLIEKARKRLAEIDAEAEELRTFLRVYQDLTGEKIAESVSGAEEAESDSTADWEGHASPGEIVAGARQLMIDHRRPLSRSRLVKLLTENGLRLPGQDKAKNIGTVIWRSKQFDNYSGWGYWPKEFGRWVGQPPPQQASLPGTDLA